MTVCVCVLMNHPFPDNIPLIRRLYAGRFDKLLFLIPFHRSDDEDVITVYRGSYVHASYITDARERLLQVDCDHFLFIHDDVILNPAIEDASFYDYFPLGENDGFFPAIGSLPAHMGSWTWFYGFVARLLFPKSLLFGSGLESATLDRYLPPAELMRDKITAAGGPLCEGAWVNTDAFGPVEEMPSRVLFQGLAGQLAATPERFAVIEERSSDVAKRLANLMADVVSASRDRGPDHPGGEWVEFPRPFVTGGFMADCYIVPKTRLADYAHYIGVASAAQMLTEMLAPTLLYSVCDRVLSAQDCGLDLDGFSRNVDLELLSDKRVMAIHPFKMSVLRAPEEAEHFFAQIDWIRTGRSAFLAAEPGVHGFGPGGSGRRFAGPGWNYPEAWGSWSSIERPKLRFWAPDESAFSEIRLRLHFPLHTAIPRFETQVSLNGADPITIVKHPGEWPVEDVTFPGANIRIGQMNEIALLTSQMRPCDLEPGNTDGRWLGAGAVEIEFV